MSAAGQESAVDLSARDDGRNAFGAWGGASVNAPDWWGAVRERGVFLLGLRYRRTVSQSANASVAFTVDVIPAAAVTNTPVRNRRTCCLGLPDDVRRTLEVQIEQVEPGTAYGFGIVPLGLQAELFRASPVYLTLGVAGGMLLFDRDVPTLDTRKMNFTATVNAGLRVRVLAGWELTVGYKYHHLSNAGTGPNNPGLDANMLYVGWMRR